MRVKVLYNWVYLRKGWISDVVLIEVTTIHFKTGTIRGKIISAENQDCYTDEEKRFKSIDVHKSEIVSLESLGEDIVSWIGLDR